MEFHFILECLRKLVITLVFIFITFLLLKRIFRRDDRLPATTFQATARCNREAPPSCMVCLDGLTKGEKIRILPKCKHWYHVECIDAWFESHSTCPICRDHVISSLNQQNRIKNRNIVFSFILFVENFSNKLGYPLDFGISLSSCV